MQRDFVLTSLKEYYHSAENLNQFLKFPAIWLKYFLSIFYDKIYKIRREMENSQMTNREYIKQGL